MRLPIQPDKYDRNLEQRRSVMVEQEFARVSAKFECFYTGVGAPSFTPPGRALYIRQDGSANTTLYVYEGSSWVAK